MEQLTMLEIYNKALELKNKGVDLSKIRVYLGNDEELNGVHNAYYCELIKNNGTEDSNYVVDLIIVNNLLNEDFNNNLLDKNENFILIS